MRARRDPPIASLAERMLIPLIGRGKG